MKYLLFFSFLVAISNCVSAQFTITNPVSAVKKAKANAFIRAATAGPTYLNTVKLNMSIPGYYYSNGKQQAAVVGLGLAFEHYKNDSLIYSVGPYVWYNTPIPTGSTQLPIGYGAAAGYKGLVLLGILTPDWRHWGPVISTTFSFGNGGIQFGGLNL